MKRLNNYFTILITLLLSSCGQEFLDIKRDKRQVIPQTISQLQALLDNVNLLNLMSPLQLNLIGGEAYRVSDETWQLLSSPAQKNAYIWAEDVYQGLAGDDWNAGYARILYANTALDGIEKISPTANEQQAWNNVKGSALFVRAFTHYQLAQTFCKPYQVQTANLDLGIPLRLEADITAAVVRTTIADTYEQIITDLEQAIALLPLRASSKFRPCKAAAMALLAKTYLHMANYRESLNQANACIAASEGLLNYNQLNASSRYPFSTRLYGENNPEVLYFEALPGITIMNATRFILDESLYGLYQNDDLRKTAFFFPTRGTFTFKGSYVGAYNFFGGIAIDEIYLLRAECLLRLNQTEQALQDLNELRRNRYRTGTYVALTITDSKALLQEIIAERKRELLCRGIAWEDLRRYNKEPELAVSLSRILNGQTYVLSAQSNRYVWPIPDEVITASGIAQNPR